MDKCYPDGLSAANSPCWHLKDGAYGPSLRWVAKLFSQCSAWRPCERAVHFILSLVLPRALDSYDRLQDSDKVLAGKSVQLQSPEQLIAKDQKGQGVKAAACLRGDAASRRRLIAALLTAAVQQELQTSQLLAASPL